MTDIIIPTYIRNESLYIRTLECFQSIVDNTDNFRIIWVDNGSKRTYIDRILDEVLPFPDDSKLMPILKKEKLGFVGATNLGIDNATEEHIVFLNNDTIVTPGWLEEMIKYDYDITAPWPSNTRNIDLAEWRYHKDKKSLNEYAKVAITMSRILNVDFVPFFCTVFKKEVIEELGKLDKDFGDGLFDDDDYLWRAREAGFKIGIAADSYVLHFGQETFKTIGDDYYNKQLVKNWKLFKTKHPEWQKLKRYQRVEEKLQSLE